jgi:hypothetical protein
LMVRVHSGLPLQLTTSDELASQNWFLASQLLARENAICRLRVGRLAMPFPQQLGHTIPHRDRLAALLAFAFAHCAIHPSTDLGE